MLEQHVTSQDTARNGTLIDTPQASNATQGYRGRAVVLRDPAPIMRVGRWLRGLREKRGISQTTLAKLCRVTSAHIQGVDVPMRPAKPNTAHTKPHSSTSPIAP
jgi:hypothetical protein